MVPDQGDVDKYDVNLNRLILMAFSNCRSFKSSNGVMKLSLPAFLGAQGVILYQMNLLAPYLYYLQK